MVKKHVSEVIIGMLAVVSIIILAVESLVPVSPGELMAMYIIDLLICIVFAWDFVCRLRSSKSSSHFMKNNGYEILAMIPALALYALETLSPIAILLRSLRLLRVIRVVLLAARVMRMMSKTAVFVQRSNLLLLSITVSVIFIGAFAALVLDSGSENARITEFSDAVWWSISTVTTVGYGDVVPSSIWGRIMGMVLMIVGISIMTVFISQVSATLVESKLKRDFTRKNFRGAMIAEVKNGIDNLDKLSESELSLLMQTIQTLRMEGRNRSMG